ncbi:UvrD-helicase domain-containing protein [Sabulilitoribacter multivorans]|uniref:DNA 3'-5' helicase n=1 Tax=Flaviramulus multivorans TaxID=1304750 RepID=A0ABS9IGD8_9FLAO|nr:UvrD-helicase domain-containing protein [Flaviramulus multivorans]MCF7559490.1 UvrD-helicase domain-containing protein [Flaviramulus multivorans]
MSSNTPFSVYNASAGSGKTYTLVKEYLKILLASNNLYLFKNILAITFTNKAVAEMKDRIIGMLRVFASKDILHTPNDMFTALVEELNLEPSTLQEKADKLLNAIVHNYAAFDISTIDGFTHKLIRTFAHDLKLPLNFEVELDQDAVLSEAVDSLIAKAGTDKELTNILVDFAIEKADDDKSWDVAYDFKKIAKLLVNENDIPFIEKLKDKTLNDFKALKNQIKKDISTTETNIVELAKSILTLIEEAGLQFDDFSGGSRAYLPNYFLKLKVLNIDIDYSTAWISNLEEKPLYPEKSTTDDIKLILDEIKPEIVSAFNQTKHMVFYLKFLKNFYKNITPLSVLNAINKELNTLKADQNKMLISEFNSIISNEIKEQPTPFIYERIGEKFKHYFIDEFQDTSQMQWRNLIPLLDNSLSTEAGSTMLVGDAKQAIYRWRGGKAEQFINLFNEKSKPFVVQQEVKNLKANYRSFEEIVNFNNGFFKFLAQTVFNNDDYKGLYENSHQNIAKKETGYVELNFLDFEKEDDRDIMFSESVLNTITKCLEHGYNLEDICVLVRKKKEGVAVANYLSQHGISIISSETLLIASAPEVNFINDLLGLLIQPKNNELKISILNYLVSLFNVEDKHTFFSTHLNLTLPNFFESLKGFNVHINSQNLLQLPLYDLAETIVRSFNLVKTSNAYIQFYMDVVLDFSQKKGSDISGFLEYFNKKKESLSVISPKGQNAVQIMTIHKSKGLEFPVVIFPYADLDIYRELEPKEWFALDEEKYVGFSHTLLNYNKDFEHFSEEGQQIYARHQSELELDNINLLYVTLTRPIEQLYILSKKDISSKGGANAKKYSGLLISYLQQIGVWNDSELHYSFGNIARSIKAETPSKNTSVQQTFISSAKEDHNIKVITKSGFLWDTNQHAAIEKGNLIHDIMSEIKTKNDVDFVINDFINASTINLEQAKTLKPLVLQIIQHPKLSNYFDLDNTIYNERDIIVNNGVVLRPDRVVVNSQNEAVIIDYKTGLEDKKHEQQLQLYQDVLEAMHLTVKKKILVYINDEIKVKDV